MPGWISYMLESRLLTEMSTTSDTCVNIVLIDRKGRGTKEPLDEGEGEECKWRQKTQYYKYSD